jgi:2-oxoglutarate ferredoxin oxidoreductase subunit delta
MNKTNNNTTQKKPVKITINEKWCKKCGICVAFCPQGVFTADEFGMPIVSYPEKCIKCMLCVIRCPDFAIDVVEEKDDKIRSGK